LELEDTFCIQRGNSRKRNRPRPRLRMENTALLRAERLICTLRCTAAVVVGLFFASQAALISWNQYLLSQDQKHLDRLNALVGTYAESQGRRPDLHLIDLYRAGLTKSRIHPTPFGGYYRLNPESGVVYNPSRLLLGQTMTSSTSELAKISLKNR
jgi:hypothetical protein